MDGPIQAVSSRLNIKIGPEGFHGLFSGQSAPWITEEAAEQGTSTATLPDAIGDGLPLIAISALDTELS
jgi:hypothetical protein